MASSTADNVKLTCLCGSVSAPSSLLASPLPFPTTFCHCDSCRTSSGSLGAWYAQLNASPSPETLSACTPFASSSSCVRLFCSTCGCHVFSKMTQSGRPERWIACAGIVDPQVPGAVRNVSRVDEHEWVSDAADGGLAVYTGRLGGRDVASYACDPADSPLLSGQTLSDMAKRAREAAAASPAQREERMQVRCRCGGVDFRVAKHDWSREEKQEEDAWYIPRDKDKFLAQLCACRSCRLALGFTLQPWCYVYVDHLFLPGGERFDVWPEQGADTSKQIPALKYFESSKGVLRSFCGTCGATVTYQDRGENKMDISVGVIRSKFGNAMIPEWLEWDRGEVSFAEEAVDVELVEAWLDKGS